MASKTIVKNDNLTSIVIDTDVNILKINSKTDSGLTSISVCDKTGEHTTVLDTDELKYILNLIIS